MRWPGWLSRSAQGRLARTQWRPRVRRAATLLVRDIRRLERRLPEMDDTFACRLALARQRRRLARLVRRYGALLE